MCAAGIKRVFWTNRDGEWEGAKVRDLADALEGTGEGGGDTEGEKLTGGAAGNGVFVTKHEVLRLRGLMANKKST